MRIQELIELAQQLENAEIAKKANILSQEISLEDFDLKIAFEKAKAAEDSNLANEIEKMIKKRAKQIYYDDEYTVFIAEMKYYYVPSKTARKYYNAETGERKYHAIWICGVDPVQPSGIWVHRLRWRWEFEDENLQITKEKIRKWMGFDKDISQLLQTEKKEWVRVQGDLRMRCLQSLEEYIEEKTNRKYHDEIWHYSHDHKDEMTISEEEIQEYARKHEWKKITKQRRRKAEEKIKIAKAKEIAKKVISKEEIKKEVVKWLEEKMKENAMQVGDHVIYMKKAMEGLYSEYIIEGKIIIIHDEHEKIEIDLPSGVYEFSLLERHRTQFERRW